MKEEKMLAEEELTTIKVAEYWRGYNDGHAILIPFMENVYQSGAQAAHASRQPEIDALNAKVAMLVDAIRLVTDGSDDADEILLNALSATEPKATKWLNEHDVQLLEEYAIKIGEVFADFQGRGGSWMRNCMNNMAKELRGE